MSAVETAKTYLFINALLIGAYLLFSLLRRATALMKVNASHRQLIQISQVLVILSISTPIVFQLFPKETIPQIQWNIFRPLSEGGLSSLKQKQSLKKRPSEVVAPRTIDIFAPSIIDRVTLLFESTQSTALALGFLLVLAFGFCLAIARLVKSAAKLYSILTAATTIRA